MRVVVFGAALAAAAMLVPPEALRSALATSAGALFEATPFLIAGVLLSRILPGRTATAYLGCGCGAGPSARSLPATAATWLVFGPLVALGRFIAAVFIARLTAISPQPAADGCGAARGAQLSTELAAMLPAALIAGVATQLEAFGDIAHMTPAAQVAGGALLAFTASPCAIGAVAVAGALHARAPLAAASFLCVAGIADLRALAARRARRPHDHDLLAYAMLALALGIVGWRRGGALVHPAIAPALMLACAAAIVLSVRHHARQNARARLAPAVMLLGAVVAAPAPAYHATETTLSDTFPGERVTFTGALTRTASAAALVRFAITCCRADAAPVVVRLAHAPAFPQGTWLRVDGVIETSAAGVHLATRRVERIVPPTDPFIYR